MLLPCAACLLVLRLASAEDAPPPTAVPDAPTPPPAATEPELPSPTRLALRDPFEFQPRSPGVIKVVSPDLIDPFEHPAPSAPSTRSADLRDPFVEGAVRRCIPDLDGVPVQRPRGLERSDSACAAIDRPLRNPFLSPKRLPPPPPAPAPRSR